MRAWKQLLAARLRMCAAETAYKRLKDDKSDARAKKDLMFMECNIIQVGAMLARAVLTICLSVCLPVCSLVQSILINGAVRSVFAFLHLPTEYIDSNLGCMACLVGTYTGDLHVITFRCLSLPAGSSLHLLSPCRHVVQWRAGAA